MKNIFIVLSLVVALGVSAQSTTYLKKGGKFVGLNESSDTLTASATINYTVVLGGEIYGRITIAVESDSVSGTSAYSAYLQKSMNNEDWINVDTVAHTGGADDYAEFDAQNADHNYYRVRIVATSAAQKSNLKTFGRLSEGIIIEKKLCWKLNF